MIEAILEIVKLASVGILSGIFAMILSAGRSRHEKWWLMRVQAYQDCISSLSEITQYYEFKSANWNSLRQFTSEKTELQLKQKDARNQIRKYKDTGAFLFSKEAEDVLADFINFNIDYANISDPSDIYDPMKEISESCLKRLVAISRRDLRVSEDWL